MQMLFLYQSDSITANAVQPMPVYKGLVEEATTEETELYRETLSCIFIFHSCCHQAL